MTDITCTTIISRDVGLLSWCVENARARAGVDHDWLVIGWNPTPEVEDWCNSQGIPIRLFKPKDRSLFSDRTTWFLRALYQGWNMGYEHAETKWVARMGSDQFFSKNWLKNLMEAAEKHGERGIYHTWTVESEAAKHSRHEIRNWGTTWQEFNARQFDLYADDLIHRTGSTKAVRANESNLWFRHPTRGKQMRPDGVTWLQTKALWDEFGPMSDVLNSEGVTGDVSYMDAMYDAGVPGWLVPRSASFHLVAGESRQDEVRTL